MDQYRFVPLDYYVVVNISKCSEKGKVMLPKHTKISIQILATLSLILSFSTFACDPEKNTRVSLQGTINNQLIGQASGSNEWSQKLNYLTASSTIEAALNQTDKEKKTSKNHCLCCDYLSDCNGCSGNCLSINIVLASSELLEMNRVTASRPDATRNRYYAPIFHPLKHPPKVTV